MGRRKENVREIKIRLESNDDDFVKSIADLEDSYGEEIKEQPNSSFGISAEKEEDIEEELNHESHSHTEEISFIEFAIINSYLHESYRGKQKDFLVSSYGTVDNLGRITYRGGYDITQPYWFLGRFNDYDNDVFLQTKIFVDSRNELITQLHISINSGDSYAKILELIKKLKSISFNNSEYRGKCIKVKLRDGRFRGIEIIDVSASSNSLILNEVQNKYIQHFISRVSRNGYARYLLNGEPGTGKTESIREIARKLMPMVTFIIPDFSNTDDLSSIMEACEIFEPGVLIMDDIDLYLGSRDNGSYTRLLGQFLSFFDGVKKRKISLLASTNDKGLVDKAAERPGRFNFTLDYSFLDSDQIIKVCEIHLPEKWRIKEVYDALTGKVNGKKVNITGAFIANLADNIKEMSEDDKDWSVDDTVSLIKESYKGFYQSQIDKEKDTMGFKTN